MVESLHFIGAEAGAGVRAGEKKPEPVKNGPAPFLIPLFVSMLPNAKKLT